MEVLHKPTLKGGGKQNPKKLIIHSMSEYIKGLHASDFLESIGLSAHFLISPNGQLIKCRSTELVAYHAKGHNKDSIGIELLVKGENTYPEFKKKIIKGDCFTKYHYDTLIDITRDIMEYWKIPLENVLRHSDVSPERKVDVGVGFDWDYFKSQL